MDLDAILQSFDEEIAILQQVRALLTDDTPTENPKRRKFSAEARAKMAAAQKARRAKTKVT